MTTTNQYLLDKTIVEKLLSLKGEVRGIVFKTDAEYVLKIRGEMGLKTLEESLRALGCPINYREINTMDFFPIGKRVISLLAIKNFLNFSEEEIENMGRTAPKLSLIIRLFMKYFLSIKNTIGQTPNMWKKHYTIGLLEGEANEEKREIILNLKDFRIHPIMCLYLKGYFATVGELIVKSKISIKETKCVFRGDPYHQYIVNW